MRQLPSFDASKLKAAEDDGEVSKFYLILFQPVICGPTFVYLQVLGRVVDVKGTVELQRYNKQHPVCPAIRFQ